MSRIQEFTAFIRKLKIFQPSPTIYDSIAGFTEFGPYGASIKNNLVNAIKKEFRKAEFWEVEHPLILPQQVWKASGHADRFVDIIAESDGKVYRVDKMIEEEYPELSLINGGLATCNSSFRSTRLSQKAIKNPCMMPANITL